MRVYRAIGRPELADDPDYVDPVRRQEHGRRGRRARGATWVAERTLDEAMAVFEAAEVTAAPVYDAEQLLADEHLQARGTFVEVDDPDFGPMTVQAPVAQMSETPGRVDHLGRALGADNDAVFGGLLGLDAGRLDDAAGGGRHLTIDYGVQPCTTPGSTLGAGHAGQQRAHVREGRRLRGRPRVPRSRGRVRAARPRSRPGPPPSPRSPSRTGAGRCAPCASTASTRRGATATSSRSSPARARRSTSSSCPRPVRRATSGGSTCCSPSSRRSSGSTHRIGLEVLIEEAEGLANAAEIARAERPARGDHLRRGRPVGFACTRGSTATSIRSASTRATSGTYARLQVVTAARAAGIDAIDAPYPAYQDPEGYRRSAMHAQPARLRRQVGHPSRARSPSPTRSSRPPPDEIADAARSRSRSTGAPRPKASAPSAATASWSTPPTCASRPTSCTKPPSPTATPPPPDRTSPDRTFPKSHSDGYRSVSA